MVLEWLVHLSAYIAIGKFHVFNLLLVEEDDKLIVYSVLAWIQARTCIQFKVIRNAPRQNMSTKQAIAFIRTNTTISQRYNTRMCIHVI